jgi:hypothetical protein
MSEKKQLVVFNSISDENILKTNVECIDNQYILSDFVPVTPFKHFFTAFFTDARFRSSIEFMRMNSLKPFLRLAGVDKINFDELIPFTIDEHKRSLYFFYKDQIYEKFTIHHYEVISFDDLHTKQSTYKKLIGLEKINIKSLFNNTSDEIIFKDVDGVVKVYHDGIHTTFTAEEYFTKYRLFIDLINLELKTSVVNGKTEFSITDWESDKIITIPVTDKEIIPLLTKIV